MLASSAAVYGGGHSEPINETSFLSPYSPYGVHKRVGELLFESYGKNFGLNVAIVRLFSVYGSNLRKQLLWDLCLRLQSDPGEIVLEGLVMNLRDLLHVEDAVVFLKKVSNFACPECFIVNGGTGIATSVNDIAHSVISSWDPKVKIMFTGIARKGDPKYLVANTDYGNL